MYKKKCESFVAHVTHVIDGGRVTVPKHIRQQLEIEGEACVRINLVKLEETKKKIRRYDKNQLRHTPRKRSLTRSFAKEKSDPQ